MKLTAANLKSLEKSIVVFKRFLSQTQSRLSLLNHVLFAYVRLKFLQRGVVDEDLCSFILSWNVLLFRNTMCRGFD